MSQIDQEELNIFLEETCEDLDKLDNNLVVLEGQPENPELINEIFRSLHTIKGSAGFFNFDILSKVAHAGENLLGRVRDGKARCSSEVITVLLAVADGIRAMLDSIEQGEGQGEEDFTSLIARVNGISGAETAAEPEKVISFAEIQEECLTGMGQGLTALSLQPDELSGVPQLAAALTDLEDAATREEFINLALLLHAMVSLLEPIGQGKVPVDQAVLEVLGLAAEAVGQLTASIAETGKEGDLQVMELISDLVGLRPVASPPASGVPKEGAAAGDTAEVTQIGSPAEAAGPEGGKTGEAEPDADSWGWGEAAAAAKPAGEAKKSKALKKEKGEQSIRVDVKLLDSLMSLVGELVLTRNQVLQEVSLLEDHSPELAAVSQRLNLITSELQEGFMKTRMQPIKKVWSKFPRVVRDLARKCGKKIRLEMVGEDTELDKGLIEAINDPLVHLVRNCVDHGIEGPESRRANGKNEEGFVMLRAFHEGGLVNIDITDDGGGIDGEKLAIKAVDRGLLAENVAARMSDKKLLELIFLPGFSSAKEVTDLSGRGVGMDVVKTNIETLGGSVDVFSELGKGTTIKLRVPLTLAIIPAIICSCRGIRYAIPQASLMEFVRLEEGEGAGMVESIHGAPVYRLRNQLLPLIYLDKALALTARQNGDESASCLNIVVLQAEKAQFGLVVDDILDAQEIVVKPLSRQVKDIPLYAGTTILGDGGVSLILNVVALEKLVSIAGPPSEESDWAGGQAEEAALAGDSELASLVDEVDWDMEFASLAEEQEEKKSLLVFEGPRRSRMAIFLDKVKRLEKFPGSMVEDVGEQRIVQYRGSIMPLIDLSRYLAPAVSERQGPAMTADELIQVVVFFRAGRNLGLAVPRILDVVDEIVELTDDKNSPYILGRTVVSGRITEIVNVEEILDSIEESAP